jgi:hypothetical protein
LLGRRLRPIRREQKGAGGAPSDLTFQLPYKNVCETSKTVRCAGRVSCVTANPVSGRSSEPKGAAGPKGVVSPDCRTDRTSIHVISIIFQYSIGFKNNLQHAPNHRSHLAGCSLLGEQQQPAMVGTAQSHVCYILTPYQCSFVQFACLACTAHCAVPQPAWDSSSSASGSDQLQLRALLQSSAEITSATALPMKENSLKNCQDNRAATLRLAQVANRTGVAVRNCTAEEQARKDAGEIGALHRRPDTNRRAEVKQGCVGGGC